VAGDVEPMPIGPQAGKGTRLGKQPVRVSLNPKHKFADDGGLPKPSIKLKFSLRMPAELLKSGEGFS